MFMYKVWTFEKMEECGIWKFLKWKFDFRKWRLWYNLKEFAVVYINTTVYSKFFQIIFLLTFSIFHRWKPLILSGLLSGSRCVYPAGVLSFFINYFHHTRELIDISIMHRCTLYLVLRFLFWTSFPMPANRSPRDGGWKNRKCPSHPRIHRCIRTSAPIWLPKTRKMHLQPPAEKKKKKKKNSPGYPFGQPTKRTATCYIY